MFEHQKRERAHQSLCFVLVGLLLPATVPSNYSPARLSALPLVLQTYSCTAHVLYTGGYQRKEGRKEASKQSPTPTELTPAFFEMSMDISNSFFWLESQGNSWHHRP